MLLNTEQRSYGAGQIEQEEGEDIFWHGTILGSKNSDEIPNKIL